MSFEEFAADLPRHHSQWFTSPEALEEAFKHIGVHQPTRQAGRGDFRAGLAYRKYPDCELFSDRYSTDLSDVAGFSLHAGVATKANERVKLERLCRYITRPAVSTKRLSMTRNGQVR